MASFLTLGVVRHETAAREASQAVQAQRFDRALAALKEMQHAAGIDTNALRWRVQLAGIEPLALSQQGIIPPTRGIAMAETSLEWIDEVIDRQPGATSAVRLKTRLLDQLARSTGEQRHFDEARLAYSRLAELSPFNVADRLAWADLEAFTGRDRVAFQQYQLVMELRELSYLDEADPLEPAQLEHVKQQLSRLRSP